MNPQIPTLKDPNNPHRTQSQRHFTEMSGRFTQEEGVYVAYKHI